MNVVVASAPADWRCEREVLPDGDGAAVPDDLRAPPAGISIGFRPRRSG
jgi:hypothetical protein